MKVSVVVCTYSDERYEHFTEAVESVLNQQYESIEIVLVSDGNDRVAEKAREDFGDFDTVIVHCNDKNQGVSISRTKGAELASGDVVAFIDDDAIADPEWISVLVREYQSRDTLAVGGKMVGEWITGRPWYLPAEFNWLVGVTHRGFAESGDEVRNTFESNISFRRDVFLELGGFDPGLGPTADSYSHSEGAEIGARLQAEFGTGMKYNSDAVVRHKVFEHRSKFTWLCRRAFDQGISKQKMERRTAALSGEEFRFLQTLLITHVPNRVRNIRASPSIEGIGQIIMVLTLTSLVGAGYASEMLRSLLD